jgi:hypothetical protein
MDPEVAAIHHDRNAKKDWCVDTKPTTKVLVIGDSNLRTAKTRGTDYEVHSFPGAHLSHVYDILYESELSESITDVVIAVGINHRDANFKDTRTLLNRIARRTVGMDQRVHFLGVSTAEKPNGNIQDLNATARDKFGTRYIAPLPLCDVSIDPGDVTYGIHHDSGTVQKILHSIRTHLGQSEFLNEY